MPRSQASKGTIDARCERVDRVRELRRPVLVHSDHLEQQEELRNEQARVAWLLPLDVGQKVLTGSFAPTHPPTHPCARPGPPIRDPRSRRGRRERPAPYVSDRSLARRREVVEQAHEHVREEHEDVRNGQVAPLIAPPLSSPATAAATRPMRPRCACRRSIGTARTLCWGFFWLRRMFRTALWIKKESVRMPEK